MFMKLKKGRFYYIVHRTVIYTDILEKWVSLSDHRFPITATCLSVQCLQSTDDGKVSTPVKCLIIFQLPFYIAICCRMNPTIGPGRKVLQ